MVMIEKFKKKEEKGDQKEIFSDKVEWKKRLAFEIIGNTKIVQYGEAILPPLTSVELNVI